VIARDAAAVRPHRRQLLISELIDVQGRVFQLASRFGLAEASNISRASPRAQVPSTKRRGAYRISLANYFAPPDDALCRVSCRSGSAELRRDVLAQRFNSGFEQVCHRLTTLQRPNAPAFLLHAAGRQCRATSQAVFLRHLPFSKFGEALSVVERAFDLRYAGRLLKQVIELARRHRISRSREWYGTDRAASAGAARSRSALVVNPHAAKLVYAAGMDLEKTEGTPIGVNCRLCERENCSQRAEPPITRTLILDENTRRVSSFAFQRAGAVRGCGGALVLSRHNQLLPLILRSIARSDASRRTRPGNHYQGLHGSRRRSRASSP